MIRFRLQTHKVTSKFVMSPSHRARAEETGNGRYVSAIDCVQYKDVFDEDSTSSRSSQAEKEHSRVKVQNLPRPTAK